MQRGIPTLAVAIAVAVGCCVAIVEAAEPLSSAELGKVVGQHYCWLCPHMPCPYAHPCICEEGGDDTICWSRFANDVYACMGGQDRGWDECDTVTYPTHYCETIHVYHLHIPCKGSCNPDTYWYTLDSRPGWPWDCDLEGPDCLVIEV